MFVRWKKRKSTGNRNYHAWQDVKDVTLSAFLVESKRIDGKPRQKVIAFLHSIHQHDLQRGGWIGRTSRFYFWYHVRAKLRTLNLSEDQMLAISATLAKTVPLLTDEELAEQKADNERLRMITGKM